MHRDFLMYVAEEGSVLLSPRDVQLLDWKSFEFFRASGWINSVATMDGSRIVQITPLGLAQAGWFANEMDDELTRYDYPDMGEWK